MPTKKHAGAKCWRTPARKNTNLTVRLPGGSLETILVTNEKVKPKPLTKQQRRKKLSAGYTYTFSFQCRGVQFHKGTTMRSWTADLDTRLDREGIVQGWVLQAISEVAEAETKEKNEGERGASAINDSAALQLLAGPPRVLQQPEPMDTTGEEEEEESAQDFYSLRAATPPFAGSRNGVSCMDGVSYTDSSGFDYRHDKGLDGHRGGKDKVGKYGSEHARRAEHEQRQRERAERRASANREKGFKLLRAIAEGNLSPEQQAQVIEAGTGGAPLEVIGSRRERQLVGELKRLLFELGRGDPVMTRTVLEGLLFTKEVQTIVGDGYNVDIRSDSEVATEQRNETLVAALHEYVQEKRTRGTMSDADWRSVTVLHQAASMVVEDERGAQQLTAAAVSKALGSRPHTVAAARAAEPGVDRQRRQRKDALDPHAVREFSHSCEEIARIDTGGKLESPPLSPSRRARPSPNLLTRSVRVLLAGRYKERRFKPTGEMVECLSAVLLVSRKEAVAIWLKSARRAELNAKRVRQGLKGNAYAGLPAHLNIRITKHVAENAPQNVFAFNVRSRAFSASHFYDKNSYFAG